MPAHRLHSVGNSAPLPSAGAPATGAGFAHQVTVPTRLTTRPRTKHRRRGRAPVFVDASGRRRRAVRAIAITGSGAFTFCSLFVMTALFGGRAPSTLLPLTDPNTPQPSSTAIPPGNSIQNGLVPDTPAATTTETAAPSLSSTSDSAVRQAVRVTTAAQDAAPPVPLTTTAVAPSSPTHRTHPTRPTHTP
jgi:hypothetical protein